MANQKPPNITDEFKEDTHTEEEDVMNCRNEVLITVALSIVTGQTYPEIEADLREVGMCISTKEAEMATAYAIGFLRDNLGKPPEDVADFCAKAELPLPRDLLLGIARHLPPFD
jgi:Tfp pilus assembly protein FimV